MLSQREPPKTMIHDPDAPTYEIVRQEQARLFGRIVGARVAVLPILVLGLIAVAWFQPLKWQSRVLLTLALLVPFYFICEWLYYRARGLTPTAFTRNLAAGVGGHLVIAGVTGGLMSPFIYPIIPLGVLVGVLLDAGISSALLAVQLAGVWGFALAAAQRWPEFGITALNPEGAQVHSEAFYYYHAAFLSVALIAVNQLGQRFSAGCTAILGRHLSARHELLRANADRVRELTGLSAEIAHELKNPLASVKGLSALLAQNVVDEKGNERLSVLRREVDRMQSVLEEFLNFSRPLIPLTIVPCDAADIVHDVAALHEGLAQQRSVQLECNEVGPAPLRSDPRKVKQILINLVQNALDASPRGGTITLRTEMSEEHIVVQVIDEGPGLDPALNVFEPGVTSKSGGAGLGLTIARALARQHGGELKLASGASGGAVATLTLPLQPTLDDAKGP